MFKFKRDKLNTQKKLGSGSNSLVHPYSDDRWAVKIIYTDDLKVVLESVEEIMLGFRCEHNAILPIRGYYIEPTDPTGGWNILIKMPRMRKSLDEIVTMCLTERKCIPERNIVKYFYNLVCGIEYLHKKREIAHKNIKTSNILFDKDSSVKLADISKGKLVIDNQIVSSENKNNHMYIAPEILSSGYLSKKKEELYKADVWSLGVIIAELCFIGPRHGDLGNILGSKEEIEKMMIELEEKYSRELLNIIRFMVQRDPNNRKSIEEIKVILEKSFNLNSDSEKMDVLKDKQEIKEIVMLHQVKELLEKQQFKGSFEFEKDKQFSVSSENSVTDEKVKDFITKLEETSKEYKVNSVITDFEFNLLMCDRITDRGVTSLSAGIGIILPNLQKLSLKFTGCTEITDQGIRDLGHLGANLSKLQQLMLNFRWCQKITNEGIKILGSMIGNKLKMLQVLWVDFRNCPKITAEGVQDFASQISNNLKDLQELNLKFACCEGITDAGLRALYPCIGAALPKLKRLTLIFLGCPKITSAGVKDLGVHIKTRATQIKELSLDFRDLEKLNDGTKLEVIKMLNGISTLSLLF